MHNAGFTGMHDPSHRYAGSQSWKSKNRGKEQSHPSAPSAAGGSRGLFSQIVQSPVAAVSRRQHDNPRQDGFGLRKIKRHSQCWGSGSEAGSAGSACFWASRIRVHYSEVRIRILPFSHKCVERTEIMPAK
jgi:hypothetical protein